MDELTSMDPSQIFMSKDGEPMKFGEMSPSSSFIMNLDGTVDDKQLTKADIVNKSISELKEMGFTSVFD